MARRRRWWLTLSVGLAAPFVLAGCSEEIPELQFGTAEPSAEQLSAAPPPSGSLSVAEWPDACETLSDGEIQAILPQATDFNRTPQQVTIMNFNPLTESDPGSTGDIPSGGCEYQFGLPSEYYPEGNSTIKVVFTAIADPALVQQHYAEDLESARESGLKFQDLGDSLGAEGCHEDGTTHSLVCYQGAYQFEVSGMSTADGVGEYPESEQNWSDKVLSQVVATLGSRAS